MTSAHSTRDVPYSRRSRGPPSRFEQEEHRDDDGEDCRNVEPIIAVHNLHGQCCALHNPVMTFEVKVKVAGSASKHRI